MWRRALGAATEWGGLYWWRAMERRVTRGRAKRRRGEVGEFCLFPAAAPLAASSWILGFWP
jgi:hypothetical protein